MELDKKLQRLEELTRIQEITYNINIIYRKDTPETYDKLLRECEDRLAQIENDVLGNNAHISTDISSIKEQVEKWEDITDGIEQNEYIINILDNHLLYHQYQNLLLH